MTHVARNAVARSILVIAASFGLAVSDPVAQIGPNPSPLADPRPDPLLLMPLVSTHTQLRVAGTVHPGRSVVDAADYPVVGRLTVYPPAGSAVSFDVAFESVPGSLNTQHGFIGTIRMSELIGEVPTNSAAILTLDCTNCPRGSRLGAGMHLEDVSVVQGPAFAPYFTSVLDPKIDGVLDPRSDGVIDPKGDGVLDPKGDGVLDPKGDSVIDPKGDSVAIMPVVSEFTQLHIAGVLHTRRPVRELDPVGLIGDTPTIRGRVTLMLPDGASRFFDIELRTIGEKDMPNRLGFAGVVSLNLIGDVPANSSASVQLDCVNCPAGTSINAGVYVEETSAAPNPSFAPYLVGVIDPKNDGFRRQR